MKKLIPILLSLIIVYNSIGSFIALKIIQYNIKREIKREIKKGVPAEDYILVKLTDYDIDNEKNGFRYFDDDKEFRYNNSMYDIIKKKVVNDTNYFYCINDKKEEILFQNIDLLVKNNLDTNIPAKKHSEAISWLIIKGLVQDKDRNPLLRITKNIDYFNSDDSVLELYYDILTPPPKQIHC